MKHPVCRKISLLSAVVLINAANGLAQDSPVPPAVLQEESETAVDTIYDLGKLTDRLNQLEADNQRLTDQLNSLESRTDAPATVIHRRWTQKFLNTPKKAGVFGGADYLRWTFRQPGLEYGITDIGGVQDRGAVGTVLDLDTDYQDGVRVKIGYRFDAGNTNGILNRPELLFSYTNFESDLTDTFVGPLRASFITSDNSENDDADDTFTGSPNDVTPDDRATAATAVSQFQYDVYDIDFAQSLQLTDTLTLRLSTGARIATIDEFFQVTYTGGDFQTAFTAFRDWRYNGAGITTGGSLNWVMTDHLSIDVGLKTGLVIGEHSSRFFFPDDEPGVPTDVRQSITRVNPFLEMSAGLNYARPVGDSILSVGAGYEFVNWFNVADNRTFSDSFIEGQNVNSVRDLTLDGFYARVALNF